jgi:hypothetical protein
MELTDDLYFVVKISAPVKKSFILYEELNETSFAHSLIAKEHVCMNRFCKVQCVQRKFFIPNFKFGILLKFLITFLSVIKNGDGME